MLRCPVAAETRFLIRRTPAVPVASHQKAVISNYRLRRSKHCGATNNDPGDFAVFSRFKSYYRLRPKRGTAVRKPQRWICEAVARMACYGVRKNLCSHFEMTRANVKPWMADWAGTVLIETMRRIFCFSPKIRRQSLSSIFR